MNKHYNPIIISKIRSTTHNDDKRVLFRLDKIIKSTLKGRGINPASFVIHKDPETRTLTIEPKNNSVNFSVIESALEKISYKNNWAWDIQEQYSQEDEHETSNEYINKLRKERKRIGQQFAEYRNKTSEEIRQYRENENRYKNRIQMLEELNKGLEEKIAGKQPIEILPKSSEEFYNALVTKNADEIRAYLDKSKGDIDFYVKNNVFENLDDLIELSKSAEDDLISPLVRKISEKSADMANKLKECKTDQEIMDTVSEWTDTEYYQTNIDAYTRAVEYIAYIKKLKDDSSAPEDVYKILFDENTLKPKKKIIEEFKKNKKAHEQMSDVAKALSETRTKYNLVNKIQERADAARKAELSVNYIVYYKAGENPTLNVLAPAIHTDAQIGEIVLKPLYDIAKKYSNNKKINVESKNGISFVEISISGDNWDETTRKRQAVSRRMSKIEDMLNKSKEKLEFFGLEPKITRVQEYQNE